MGKQRSSLRQVPWPSWAHWQWVANGLFSNSPAHISAALDRIASWRSRGNVPIAVEITAALIGIHQRDPQVKQGISQEADLPEDLLRMMYAMAIQRLVNGVVDQSQKRSTTSVVDRAELAGLPRLLVDIRHEAAHTEIPGIALLQVASKKALAWLKSQYWDQQSEILLKVRQELKSKVVEHCGVLVEIWTLREPAIDHMQSTKKEDVQESLEGYLSVKKQQRRALFKEVLDLSVSSVSDLIAILVDDGLLGQDTLPTLNELDDRKQEVRTDSMGCYDLTSATDNAWKFTLRKLFSNLPQLPGILLVAILKQIKASSSHLPAETAEFHPVDSIRVNRLVSWCAWLLGKGISQDLKSVMEQEPNQCKLLKKSNELSVKADLSNGLFCELLRMCLLTSRGRGPLLELVPFISAKIGNEKFQQRAIMLAHLGTSMQRTQRKATDTCGWTPSEEKISEQSSMTGNIPNTTSEESPTDCLKLPSDISKSQEDSEMLASDSALEIARRQQRAFFQRVSLQSYAVSTSSSPDGRDSSSDCCPPNPNCRPSIANLKLTNSLHPRREAQKQESVSVGCWTVVENWQPCAIGTVPSPFHLTGIMPGLELQQSVLEDQLVVSKALVDESHGKKPFEDATENKTGDESLVDDHADNFRVGKRKNGDLDGPMSDKKSRRTGFHVKFDESSLVVAEMDPMNPREMSPKGELDLEQPSSPGKEQSQDGALMQGGRLIHVSPLLLEFLQSAVHVL